MFYHYFLTLASDNHYSTFCLYEFNYLDINGIIQYLCFCVWLISLSTMPSRIIHVIVCIKIVLLLKAK